MCTIGEGILRYCDRLPEGRVVSAKGLLHLGSRAAIDKALSRLARRGELVRIGWGLYLRSAEPSSGVGPARTEEVVNAIASLTGERIAPCGAASANALGLTTQEPARTTYLTSGPGREIQLGDHTVELKHAPAWQLHGPTRPAGHAVRALAWLGPSGVEEAAEELRDRLTRSERRALVSARTQMPSWLAAAVSRKFPEEAAEVL